MWEGLCAGGGLLVLVAGSWLFFRVRTLKRIFSDSHVLEVAEKLGALKQGVITPLEAQIESPADPRVPRTSAGLVVLHTATRREPGRYVHHASVSIPGSYTAGAVGQYLHPALGASPAPAVRPPYSYLPRWGRLSRRVGTHRRGAPGTR